MFFKFTAEQLQQVVDSSCWRRSHNLRACPGWVLLTSWDLLHACGCLMSALALTVTLVTDSSSCSFALGHTLWKRGRQLGVLQALMWHECTPLSLSLLWLSSCWDIWGPHTHYVLGIELMDSHMQGRCSAMEPHKECITLFWWGGTLPNDAVAPGDHAFGLATWV